VKSENLLNETNIVDFPLIAKIGELLFNATRIRLEEIIPD
jgi:hypothetical protein